MAKFACPVVKLTITSHPNADKLEIAQVGDYQSIVQKGIYKTGDLAVYIPEQAIVPENVQDTLGLRGKLSGSQKNRVKAVKLRGVLSQGLIYGFVTDANQNPEGTDMAAELGITKYEPPIPTELIGEVNSMFELAFKFDVENFKAFPDVFKEGEDVVITEKLHGTFTYFGLINDPVLLEQYKDNLIDGEFLVGSKGNSAKGIFFKPEVNNTYTRNLSQQIKAALKTIQRNYNSAAIKSFFLIGESLGVQKGFNYAGAQFRAFGAGAVLSEDRKNFLNYGVFKTIVSHHGVVTVPTLFTGAFHKESMKKLAEGTEQVSGEDAHIREGVVIYPLEEDQHPDIGRKILKYVGEGYLLGTSGEEIN